MFSFLSSGPLGELLAPVKTPVQQFHQAIEDHLNEKAMKLIQEGVYFNAPDSSRDDCLPIHTACKAGNMAMLNTLIEMGADVNSKDRSGNIPLHAAAKAGKMDMVKHLISIGADVARRNNYHQTPYDVSTSHIVRQYLLPLQLRAEPEPAPGTLASVHNPDVIRDYSNLAPPPTTATFAPPQPAAPIPTNYSIKSNTYTDNSVLRPIAADGFHCSVGDPALAAKYGHIKTQVQVAPPPKPLDEGGEGNASSGQQSQQPRPQANPTQYSAFAAYGGRPPPRYVTYNINNNTTAPFMPGSNSSSSSSPVPPAAPLVHLSYASQPPPSLVPVVPPGSSNSGGGTSSARNTPTSVAPPPPNHPSVSVSPPLTSTPPPPPPPQLSWPRSHSPYGMQTTSSSSSNTAASTPPPPPPLSNQRVEATIPTLPGPNTISVFQPLADSGEDAIPLDGSVSRHA